MTPEEKYAIFREVESELEEKRNRENEQRRTAIECYHAGIRPRDTTPWPRYDIAWNTEN